MKMPRNNLGIFILSGCEFRQRAQIRVVKGQHNLLLRNACLHQPPYDIKIGPIFFDPDFFVDKTNEDQNVLNAIFATPAIFEKIV